MNKKAILGAVAAGILLVILSIVGWYWYQGEHYVTTEDARVAANLVVISPEIGGKIVEWNIKEGDMVRTGDVLGRQDLGTTLSSGTINISTMGTVGGIAAEKASIKTPISGQVIRSSAVLGQMAVPGSNLAVVADTDQLYISANIEEDHIARVVLGQKVELTIDAFPGVNFQGRVETIGRATTATFSLLPTQQVLLDMFRLLDGSLAPGSGLPLAPWADGPALVSGGNRIAQIFPLGWGYR